MSALWQYFTRENPCPQCGHFDGDYMCRAGDRAYICHRIGSQFPAKGGGWYHFYDDTPKPEIKVETKQSKPKVNLDFEKACNSGKIFTGYRGDLAKSLGVNADSIIYLRAFQFEAGIDKEWSIPMRDGENKIIGIHLRCDDGSKKAVLGSKNGLFIPQCESQKVAYLPEGMSNTAALLTLGFYAIGRPSCNSGGDMLKVCLKRLGINRVVIVADNDCIKSTPNGKNFRPGQDGALKLKKELGLLSVILTTPNPVKDVRELLSKLGIESARAFIESSVANKIWTKA